TDGRLIGGGRPARELLEPARPSPGEAWPRCRCHRGKEPIVRGKGDIPMQVRGKIALGAALGVGLALVSSGPINAQTIEIDTANVSVINAGDTAWMLACCGLVLLMTPGLALFYG